MSVMQINKEVIKQDAERLIADLRHTGLIRDQIRIEKVVEELRALDGEQE